jgi:FkbH-like protein
MRLRVDVAMVDHSGSGWAVEGSRIGPKLQDWQPRAGFVGIATLPPKLNAQACRKGSFGQLGFAQGHNSEIRRRGNDGPASRLTVTTLRDTLAAGFRHETRRSNSMSQDVVLLGDRTLALLARSLNSQLRQLGSQWNVIDSGYDTWLVAPLDPHGILFDKSTAAWAFVLSPRVLENVPDVAAQVDAILERLASMDTLPTVLFSNLFIDPVVAMPLSESLQRHALATKINDRLLAFREAHPWFYVVDQLSVALRYGVDALHDPRFEATAQTYFSPSGTRLISALWLRALRSLERPAKKVCVVDLDNTLWGGILGEDGADGLQMSDSGSGLAYRRFQRSLLELKRNGILLTICSKNNYDEAMDILRSHPDCILRPSDFAHIEIGWGPKSEAIARTAETLGLGLDSFVFIDDSAVEREEVTSRLPAVEVFRFPEDPTRLLGDLSEYSGFDSLRQTDEDRKRADSYLLEAQRKASRSSATTAEHFYRSLELQLGIFSARQEQAGRLHQLLMKTNQFNLTTERLAAEDFRALLTDPAYMVMGLRVSDRFGDSGITGLAIVDKRQPEAWVVQNLLLSCRVIGRTVENAFLSWIIVAAGNAGVAKLSFRYVPSGRNHVALSFLQSSGGTASASGDAWTFDVGRPEVVPTHFVRIDDTQVTR